MKPREEANRSSTLPLWISLGANVLLLAFASVLARKEFPASAAVSPTTTTKRAIELREEAKSPAVTPVAAAQSGAPEHRAPRLTPDSVARLEREGLSRGIVVEVLLQDFNRRWESRVLELQKRYHPRPVPDREYIELSRLRDLEQTRELKEALGEHRYLAWDKEQTLRHFNSVGLPLQPAEAEQAYRLQKQLDETLRELQMAMEDGVADKADVATLQAQAQDSFEKEVEALLGRARYDRLRGYTNMRPLFAELNLTDEQTKLISSAESEYLARESALAKRLNDKSADPAALTAELSALNAAREENFRAALGAQTYNQLKREHDTTYQALKQFAGAWNLNDQEIEPVYGALAKFHDQASRIREAAHLSEAAGHAVDWNEINASIDNARQQTETGLLGLLGTERLHRLKQNGLLTRR